MLFVHFKDCTFYTPLTNQIKIYLLSIGCVVNSSNFNPVVLSLNLHFIDKAEW